MGFLLGDAVLGRGQVPGKPEGVLVQAGVAPEFTSCPAPLTSQQVSKAPIGHFFLGSFHRLSYVGC